MKPKSLIIWICSPTVVLSFLYVWPGVQRYQYNGGLGAVSAYRVDKLTGEIERYFEDVDRWDVRKQSTSVEKAISRTISAAELDELRSEHDSREESPLSRRFSRELGRDPTIWEAIEFSVRIDKRLRELDSSSGRHGGQ